jgi:hypothetical protein
LNNGYKVAVKIVIALGVEIYFYTRGLHRYMDSFFFVWAILFLGLFLLTLFNVDNSGLSLIAYKPTNPDIKSIKGVRGYGHEKEKRLIPSSLLAYFVMFLINLVGFLIYIRQ